MVNTATPIIQVSPTSWYAVQDAVWFTACLGERALGGRDVGAAVIYTIPPSSPLHYVTYVRIYEATPDTVYVGYTPGYYGTCVSHGTVVYGTGYYYPPYVGTSGTARPLTYGVGVGMTYTPWTGLDLRLRLRLELGRRHGGLGLGRLSVVGAGRLGLLLPVSLLSAAVLGRRGLGTVGRRRRLGARAAGPRRPATSTAAGARRARSRARSGGYNAWTGNAWRNTAGMSYNSRTGNLSAGQRSAVGNVYTGNYAYGGRGSVASTRAAAAR